VFIPTTTWIQGAGGWEGGGRHGGGGDREQGGGEARGGALRWGHCRRTGWRISASGGRWRSVSKLGFRVWGDSSVAVVEEVGGQ
jgi:hypothetical protein